MRYGPAVGGEIQEQRPAVIVSNDAANEHLNRVQVVPLTSQVARVYPSEALVTFAGRPCKAMADQLATVSKPRIIDRGGELAEAQLRQVEQAIRIQLGSR